MMNDTGGRSGCRDEPVGTTLGGRSLRGWRTPRCGTCGLPGERCVCATLPTLSTHVRVVVVMHRIEAVRSTNTGRLVARMLSRAALRVRGARDETSPEVPPGRRLVLFPRAGARMLSREDADTELTLVVPDGTWSQARRIAQRDPLAKDIEAVTLPEMESSYGLRRNPRIGALCTLEAVAEALRVTGDAAAAEALREAFGRWRDASLSWREGR